MQDSTARANPSRLRAAWNKEKLTGAKPPLRPKHIWSIRSKLQLENRVRDLAIFNRAIDSKRRGCDVVTLKVEDVAPHGNAVNRATVRQRKTGRPVQLELTEPTREAVDGYPGSSGNGSLPLGWIPASSEPIRSGAPKQHYLYRRSAASSNPSVCDPGDKEDIGDSYDPLPTLI